LKTYEFVSGGAGGVIHDFEGEEGQSNEDEGGQWGNSVAEDEGEEEEGHCCPDVLGMDVSKEPGEDKELEDAAGAVDECVEIAHECGSVHVMREGKL